MPQAGLIVIAPIRHGSEPLLRERLNHWGNDVRRHKLEAAAPSIDLTRCRSLHFFRLAILEDPNRGPGFSRLLLATDFDGSAESHLQELHSLTHHPESLWGCLEEYPGPVGFAAFLLRHQVPPAAYYMAFRGTTADQIRAANQLVDHIETQLDSPEGRRTWEAWPDVRDFILWWRGLWRALTQPVSVAARIVGAAIEAVRLIRVHGWTESIQAACRINASLSRVGWIRAFNAIFRNRRSPSVHPYSQASPRTPALPTPPGYPPEDAVLQNQLTLVTEIRPEYRAGLAAVLAIIELYARQLSSPGSLVGIGTIHTVRWVMIDHGSRLLMVSNYDGTWENYIDEFAEMILSGLDALWTSAPDYPEAGAQDVEALKEFLRSHQVPANVFYCAYPSSSVLTLKRRLEFDRSFGWFLRSRLKSAPAQNPLLIHDPITAPTSHLPEP